MFLRVESQSTEIDCWRWKNANRTLQNALKKGSLLTDYKQKSLKNFALWRLFLTFAA
jgi:hypothetical protein